MTTSRDPQKDDRLSAYLDEELLPSDREQFDREMEQDAQLRELHGQLRLLSDSLKELPRESAPRELADRIATEISQMPVERLSESLTSQDTSVSTRRRLLGAACAAVVVVGVLLYQLPDRQSEIAQLDKAEVADTRQRYAVDPTGQDARVAADDSVSMAPDSEFALQASESNQLMPSRRPMLDEQADFIELESEAAEAMPQSAPVDDSIGLEAGQPLAQSLPEGPAPSTFLSPAVKQTRLRGRGKSEMVPPIYIVRVTPRQAKSLRTQLGERGFEIAKSPSQLTRELSIAHFEHAANIGDHQVLQIDAETQDVSIVLRELGIDSMERFQSRLTGRRNPVESSADDGSVEHVRKAPAAAKDVFPDSADEEYGNDSHSERRGTLGSDQQTPAAPVILVLRIEPDQDPTTQP